MLMRSPAGLLLALGLSLAEVTPGQAQEYKGPLWGGTGGTSAYNLDCGSSGVMVGLYGKSGNWVDQIAIRCRVVNSDGSLGNYYSKGPAGGSGGAGASADCPSGSVVGVMAAVSGSFINDVSIQCFVWLAATRRLDRKQYKGIYGIGDPVSPVSLGAVSNAVVSCPDGLVGKAIRGKSGAYVDSMQFVCDAYNK